MRNILLNIGFDGTAYHGWQRQKNAYTVSQAVTEALEKATGDNDICLIGASRTDAGVHAADYPCHFKTASSIPPDKYPLALKAFLPQDIVCHQSQEVPMDFHLLEKTYQKTYQYKIENVPFPSPFLRHYRWHVPQTLDVALMQRAAQHFVGQHDFLAFCSSDTTVKTTVRTIFATQVEKIGCDVIFTVTGDGFLYNMVRIMAGTLREVGEKKLSPDDIPRLIDQKDRTQSGMTAPPQGLFLQEVKFHLS